MRIALTCEQLFYTTTNAFFSSELKVFLRLAIHQAIIFAKKGVKPRLDSINLHVKCHGLKVFFPYEKCKANQNDDKKGFFMVSCQFFPLKNVLQLLYNLLKKRFFKLFFQYLVVISRKKW